MKLIWHVKLTITAVLLVPSLSQASERPPMVAAIWSKFYTHSTVDRPYEHHWQKFKWPHHFWENVEVRRLAKNLDCYDLLLINNYSQLVNPTDFKAYLKQWRRFLERGGVIVVVSIQEAVGNRDWIHAMGRRFEFGHEHFSAFQKSSDWTNPEAELNFGPVAAKWAEFRSWSDKWVVTNKNGNNWPIVLYQKVGKGVVVVSTSYSEGPKDFGHPKHFAQIWEFVRKNLKPSPVEVTASSWGGGRFGTNTAKMTIRNISDAKIEFTPVLRVFNVHHDSKVKTPTIDLQPEQEANLSIPYQLRSGDNQLSLVLERPQRDIYARTGTRFELPDIEGLIKRFDDRLERADKHLAKLKDWPTEILEPAEQTHRNLVELSLSFKSSLKAAQSEQERIYEKITSALPQAELLATKAETWRSLKVSPRPGQKFVVCASDTLQKVFGDRTWSGPVAKTLQLELAGNEYESLQLVIVPLAGELKDLKVTCSPLKSQNATINNVQIRPVGDVFLPLKSKLRGWYPDVLLSRKKTINLPADRIAQAVWLTVHTDPDTLAEDYSATVTISADQSEPIELSLNVHVWDFSVPHKRNLPTEFSLRPNQLAAFYFGQEGFENFDKYLPGPMYRQFLEFLLKYRIAPYPYADGQAGASHLGYVGETEKLNGSIVTELDFTEYDKNVQLMLDYGVNMICAGVFFNAEESHMKSFLSKMYEHLKEQGWEKMGFVYGWDEFRPETLPKVRQMYSWVKQVAMNLKYLITIHMSHPENLPLADNPGYADIWVPISGLYSQKFATERAKYGQVAWTYIIQGFHITDNPLNNIRGLFWSLWRNRSAGFLYYCTFFGEFIFGEGNRNADVPSALSSHVGSINPDGTLAKTFCRRPNTGRNFLFYPAGRKPEDGAQASIRLEAIRDGLEDWEYFNLLKRLIEQRKTSNSSQVKVAIQLLQQIDRGTTKGGLLTQRKTVAEMIEKLKVD